MPADLVAAAVLAASVLLLVLARHLNRPRPTCVCDLWFGACVCHRHSKGAPA